MPDCQAVAFLRCGVNKLLPLMSGVRYMLRGILMSTRSRLPDDAWLSVAQNCVRKWQAMGVPQFVDATPSKPAGSHDVAQPSAHVHMRTVRAIAAFRMAMLAIFSSFPGVMDDVWAECQNELAQVCLTLFFWVSCTI
jgi:hypothetical protein